MNPTVRLLMFHTTDPVTSPITKFGGQPVWIAQPQWPLSRSTGNPMRFIAQVYLPDDVRRGGQQMAYIFMTDEEDYVDGTWEPEGGENAVILQPCAFDPVVKTIDQATGPTLQQPVEAPGAARRTFRDVELTVQFEDVPADSKKALHNLSRFGGAPRWMQGEEIPAGGPWRFLMQIDSTGAPYEINLGDGGVAYVFLSEDGSQARFLWQSL